MHRDPGPCSAGLEEEEEEEEGGQGSIAQRAAFTPRDGRAIKVRRWFTSWTRTEIRAGARNTREQRRLFVNFWECQSPAGPRYQPTTHPGRDNMQCRQQPQLGGALTLSLSARPFRNMIEPTERVHTRHAIMSDFRPGKGTDDLMIVRAPKLRNRVTKWATSLLDRRSRLSWLKPCLEFEARDALRAICGQLYPMAIANDVTKPWAAARSQWPL
ncbi:hypothetical protein LIA77_09308 [Sarocladium implicatum]|nr:hypothetical protein LIA77_09308 [Sarocladium implicatum]